MSECGKSAKAVARYYRLPLEPEIEEVAVDEERSGPSLEVAKKPDQRPLGFKRSNSQMGVRNHVTWRRKHSPIVVDSGCQYKQAAVLGKPYLFSMSDPSKSPVVSEIEFLVRYAETDKMQVVYHANYLIWCEMGRTDLIKRMGSSYGDLERKGVMLAVIDASIRYHFSARYEDTIRVRTVFQSVKSRTVTIHYTIENADTSARLATATTTLASINGDGKLVALPAHLRQAMENAVA